MGDGSPEELMDFYSILLINYGHQNWWPAETPFETIIGAILAQNVSWTGASKAISNLINAGLLEPVKLAQENTDNIAGLIRSSRYYNQKAQKIKVFMDWFLQRFDAELMLMEKEPTNSLREELINLKGFGPETVDSILLYGLNKPIFVVDAYTRRIGKRQGWFDGNLSYNDIQDFFMKRIFKNVPLYNDFHAQIVRLGNKICKPKPNCNICPVKKEGKHILCVYGCNQIIE